MTSDRARDLDRVRELGPLPATPPSKTSWSLTAECSHCGRFGTVDDITLVCIACGQVHELTDEQRSARDADTALQTVTAARSPARPSRSDPPPPGGS